MAEEQEYMKILREICDACFRLNISRDENVINECLTQIIPGADTEQMIMYISKTFKPAEQRYTGVEKELLGLYVILKRLRVCLLGFPIHISQSYKALIDKFRDMILLVTFFRFPPHFFANLAPTLFSTTLATISFKIPLLRNN